MAWIELNASDPPPPTGAQNVHFREDSAHLGTEDDPTPVSAYVSPFTGDAGSGGASGLAPAPAAGDAAAGKFLHAGGEFELPPLTVSFPISNGAAGTNVALMDEAPRDGAVSECIVTVTKSDATTPLTFQILQNGVDIFSSDPTIAEGAAVGSKSSFTALTSTPLSIAEGDVFSMNITSGSASWQFTAKLK